MPGMLVTRGLTGSATNMIARGFIPTIRSIIKGGTRFAKKVVRDIEQNLKISVMLISANGKEFSKPIISSVSKIFKSSDSITIAAKHKSLKTKKSKRIKVTAKLRD